MADRQDDAPDTVPPWQPEGSAGGTPPVSARAPMAGAPQTPAATAAAAAPGWERKLLEELAFEAVRERRAARRWKLGFRAVWLLVFVAIGYFIFMRPGTPAAPTGPHTAVIDVRGAISDDSEASAQRINRALRSAFESQDARAVVLRINSPGGSPVQSGLVHDEIRRLRALHDKPVYAVVEEAAASGAYYIAVAADRIYVDKASIVGSVGVLMNGFGFTGLMDKLGIERRLLVAGENKAMLDPFSPQTETDRRHAQALLDRIHAQFIDVVRKGRGERLKESADTFSGLIWSGEQAVELGLADAMGDVPRVAREVVKAERIVDYTQKENVAERLARRFGAGVGEGAMRVLYALPVLR